MIDKIAEILETQYRPIVNEILSARQQIGLAIPENIELRPIISNESFASSKFTAEAGYVYINFNPNLHNESGYNPVYQNLAAFFDSFRYALTYIPDSASDVITLELLTGAKDFSELRSIYTEEGYKRNKAQFEKDREQLKTVLINAVNTHPTQVNRKKPLAHEIEHIDYANRNFQMFSELHEMRKQGDNISDLEKQAEFLGKYKEKWFKYESKNEGSAVFFGNLYDFGMDFDKLDEISEVSLNELKGYTLDSHLWLTIQYAAQNTLINLGIKDEAAIQKLMFGIGSLMCTTMSPHTQRVMNIEKLVEFDSHIIGDAMSEIGSTINRNNQMYIQVVANLKNKYQQLRNVGKLGKGQGLYTRRC